MPKTVKSLEDLEIPFNFHYPAGATIVTSHAHGRDNAMAVAWHTAISRQPAYYAVCISSKRFTHSLITETKEFVVNFIPDEKSELVALVAGSTGHELAKFSSVQIAAYQGSRVEAAVLEDAFAAYECRVVGQHTYGDHEIFVGEILAVQFESSRFQEDGRLDLEQIQPIVYLGRDWYATVGKRSFLLDREALVPAALERSHESAKH